MCRFALYLGSPTCISALVTEPENSIIHQSFHSHEREEPLNGDGFGVAWYVPELSDRPAVFKDISPAWNNMNLLNLAPVTRSGCILAHVRAATPGLPVTRLNCHPFSWGRFAFMHNGHLGGFQRLLRPLRASLSDPAYHQILGSTDSEHLLALFGDELLRLPDGEPLELMATALVAAIARSERLRGERGVEEPSLLNLAVADGRRAIVTRYISGDDLERANSLYFYSGRRWVCEEGVGRMVQAAVEHHAVVLASEPLTEQQGWRRVPPNHMVLVGESLGVELRPIEIQV